MYKQSQLETHSTPTGRNGQSMAEMKPCGPRNSMCILHICTEVEALAFRS